SPRVAPRSARPTRRPPTRESATRPPFLPAARLGAVVRGRAASDRGGAPRPRRPGGAGAQAGQPAPPPAAPRAVPRGPGQRGTAGGAGDGPAVHPHAPEHLVLDEQEVARVEELAAVEEGVGHARVAGVEGAVAGEDLDLGSGGHAGPPRADDR